MIDHTLWALWRDHGPGHLIAEIEKARTERDQTRAALKALLACNLTPTVPSTVPAAGPMRVLGT